MIVLMGRLLGMLLLLAGCNQLLGIDDVTSKQDPLRDTDGDGVPDIEDNCPAVANSDQIDGDGDNRGDACDVMCAPTDPDADQDGTPDACDLCPSVATPRQHDEDSDGIGDECDNCPATANPLQEKTRDIDGLGDACDPFEKETLQSTLVFDAFAPYDPQKWTDSDGVWSATVGMDAVISSAGIGVEQGLKGKTSLGTEQYWYVETALTLGVGVGTRSESMGVGLWNIGTKTFQMGCQIQCKTECRAMIQRSVDTASGTQVIAPGTYVLRLSASGPVSTPKYVCEVVGVDSVTFATMLVSQVDGVPMLYATLPTEFRYVHAAR